MALTWPAFVFLTNPSPAPESIDPCVVAMVEPMAMIAFAVVPVQRSPTRGGVMVMVAIKRFQEMNESGPLKLVIDAR